MDTVRVPRRHGPPKKTFPRLIADKAYDSRPLRAAFAARGIDLIVPHQRNRKFKVQDGRKLRRWKVERTFAWLHTNKRIWTRSDHYICMFRGWVHLGIILIFLKRL